jgi:N-acetylmuramoyl-L-alanine amidase
MQSISPLGTRRIGIIAVVVVALAFMLVRYSPLVSAEEKKLSVYAPQGSYSLQVTDHDNLEYAGIYELLEQLGKAQLKVDASGYRIRVNDVDGEFVEGKSKVRIGRAEITLPGKVIVDHGRVLLPVRAFPSALLQFLKLRSEWHDAARRLFIENTSTRFSTDIKRPEGSLVLGFPAPVNPSVSTESGRVHLLFTREPIVFGAESIAYNDKLISNISFLERNGSAEVIVSGSSPLLASFSNGGKTITISAAPAPAVAQSQTPPTQTPAAAPEAASTPTVSSPLPNTNAEVTASSSRHAGMANNTVRFFVMVDAGHGGTETGARFTDQLSEKEVTLAIARRLRTELQNRGVPAVLLRDTDSNLSLDQRAVASNGQRAGLYVSIHAGGPGTGVRVYTALMPSPAPSPLPSEKKKENFGPFVPWETAQANFLDRSRIVANSVVTEMSDNKVNATMASAPVPPLNSIAAPAFAIEVAPPLANPAPDALSTVSYQQTLAVAMATAIVNARPKIEEQR